MSRGAETRGWGGDRRGSGRRERGEDEPRKEQDGDAHGHRGQQERNVPASRPGQPSSDRGCEQATDVECGIEQAVRGILARVVCRVQATEHRNQIRAKQAIAQPELRQREPRLSA